MHGKNKRSMQGNNIPPIVNGLPVSQILRWRETPEHKRRESPMYARYCEADAKLRQMEVFGDKAPPPLPGTRDIIMVSSRHKARPPLPEEIIKKCLNYWPGLSVRDVRGAGRKQHVVKARQIMMFVVASIWRPALSLPQIGRHFNRDHSTIFHGISCVRRRRELQLKALHIAGECGFLRFMNPKDVEMLFAGME